MRHWTSKFYKSHAYRDPETLYARQKTAACILRKYASCTAQTLVAWALSCLRRRAGVWVCLDYPGHGGPWLDNIMIINNNHRI